MRKVLSCFFIIMILMSVVPVSITATNGNNAIHSLSNHAELFWDFNTDFEGWSRTGSVPPWHTMESGIMRYDSWAGAQGVIVIDACESTPTSYEDVHASGGIKKTLELPSNAKKWMLMSLNM